MDSCYVTPKEDMHKGAYIIADPHKGLRDGALLFDAAQEELARKAAMYLAVQGIALRLIRVDDFERFMAQEQEYRNRLLKTGENAGGIVDPGHSNDISGRNKYISCS